jgi:superfamily II DNA or RNA helicase
MNDGLICPYVVWVEYSEEAEGEISFAFPTFEEAEETFANCRRQYECRILLTQVNNEGKRIRTFASYEGDS